MRVKLITSNNYSEWVEAYETYVFVVEESLGGESYHKENDGCLVHYAGSAVIDPKKIDCDILGYHDRQCSIYRESEGDIPSYCTARHRKFLSGKYKEVKVLLIHKKEQERNRKLLRKTRDALNKCGDLEKIKACARILFNYQED